MRKLKDWISGYMEYHQDSEAPVIYQKWVAVATISAALQRKVSIQVGPMKWYPNFYIILVGSPGARKGTSMYASRKLLKQLGVRLSAESTTRAQLVSRLEECTTTVVGNDGASMKAHSSLTVFSPEFSVFLGYQNNQLMMDLVDWFDCADDWSYETKTQGMNQIYGVFMNIIGATTPMLIQSALPPDAGGSGLTSRMIFVCHTGGINRHPCPMFPLQPEGKQHFKHLMSDLERILSMQGEFKMTKNYLKKYIHWYKTMPKDPPFDRYRFEGYWTRRALHLKKLVMVISASESDELLARSHHFDRALGMLKEAEETMPYAFSSLGRAKEISIIQPVMAEIALRGECTFGDLLQTFFNDTNDWELKKLVTGLKKIGYIKVVESTRGMIIRHNKDYKKGMINDKQAVG